jgi:hypothetical protein
VEYRARTLEEAIHKSLHREHAIRKQKQAELEQKTLFSILVPPRNWSHWVKIWAQYGVLGPDADSHQTILNVSFHEKGFLKSSFDVQIKGGDEFIRTLGPGSTRVAVTGNVATEISIRLRSHSTPLNVTITTSVLP